MKFSCSSESFHAKYLSRGQMTLEDFFAFCSQSLGLRYVEVEDKHFTPAHLENLPAVKALLDKYQLKLANLAFFNSFGYADDQKNEAQLANALKWMKVAKALGSANLRIFAGWMEGDETGIGLKGPMLQKPVEAWNKMAGYVDRVCQAAKKEGVSIVIENHNHGGFLSQSGDVLRLFSDLPPRSLSLLLDTGNYADGVSGIERTAYLATRHVHLKLGHILPDGTDTHFPVDKVVSTLRAHGFSGTLSIEYEGTQDPKECLPWVLARLRALTA